MKLSYNWLSDYIDLSGLTPDLVAEKLTMNAFEVESIDAIGADLIGPIVVGEIVDIQAHPDPKVTKMRVTKVIVENGRPPLQIVCGASNIMVGQRIPVALPGAIVVNRHDGSSFPIEVADRRGVQSNGMLCAAAEIGITDGDTDGILILDPALANKLGDNIQDLLCLKKDYVLTVGSRSNRGDAVCVRGLAREVSALFKRPMREPQWQIEESSEKTKYNFSVEIKDSKDCEFFAIRSIDNIKVAPSPPFIVRRLAAVGTRSINNIVDITNYVMHEWGQPMHAYDARKVQDGKFIIRRGKTGEKYTTLDGKERLLTEEMLVVADTQKAIGMPIMGGANSEVSSTTIDIALEAASFSPTTVRRGSRLLGLSSESTLRFERGIDAGTTKQALDRATYLISKYGGEAVKIGAFVAGGKAEHPPVHIELRPSEIKRHLNLDLSNSDIKDLLSRLEFSAVESANKTNKLVFAVPSFRQDDVQREIDLIEEISRMYGYNNIKDELPDFLGLPRMPENINWSIRQILAGQGLCEAYINSLIPDQEANLQNTDQSKYLPLYDNERAIKILNPLSPQHQALRQSLLPGLINVLKYNFDHGEENVWLFEMGSAYFKHANGEKSSQPANEQLKVAGILTGRHQLSSWQDASENSSLSDNKVNFFDAKGILANLFQSLNLPMAEISYLNQQKTPSVMHPGQTAQIIYKSSSQNKSSEKTPANQKCILDSKILGWIGQLHPAIVQELGVDSQTYLFELDVAVLQALSTKCSFQPVSTLPPVSRDLTVDLPQSTANAAVENCMKEETVNLKKLALVSIYPLSAELKSLSYRLTFQSDAETLKSDDIEQVLTNIRKNLKEKLNASFRT